MVIFVDTSALYALFDADDRNHDRARITWIQWLGQPVRFACSNYILLETVALIQRRLGVEAVRQFQDELVPVLLIMTFTWWLSLLCLWLTGATLVWWIVSVLS